MGSRPQDIEDHRPSSQLFHSRIRISSLGQINPREEGRPRAQKCLPHCNRYAMAYTLPLLYRTAGIASLHIRRDINARTEKYRQKPIQDVQCTVTHTQKADSNLGRVLEQ